MNSDPNVITLLDRFTVTTEDGDPDVYSPWKRLPSRRVYELVYECLALQSLSIDISIEGSIDRTSVESRVVGTISEVGVTTFQIGDGIGRYARVALKAHGAGEKPNMVLSVSLVPKGIARH